MNQQIIENLEALLAAVKAQPEALFDLNSWQETRECGTCFCVAGLACSMPRFKEMGMSWTGGEPTFKGIDMWNDGGDELFGDYSMDGLFRIAGNGVHDHELGYRDCGNMTDKELAIARIKRRIANYKGA